MKSQHTHRQRCAHMLCLQLNVCRESSSTGVDTWGQSSPRRVRCLWPNCHRPCCTREQRRRNHSQCSGDGSELCSVVLSYIRAVGLRLGVYSALERSLSWASCVAAGHSSGSSRCLRRRLFASGGDNILFRSYPLLTLRPLYSRCAATPSPRTRRPLPLGPCADRHRYAAHRHLRERCGSRWRLRLDAAGGRCRVSSPRLCSWVIIGLSTCTVTKIFDCKALGRCALSPRTAHAPPRCPRSSLCLAFARARTHLSRHTADGRV